MSKSSDADKDSHMAPTDAGSAMSASVDPISQKLRALYQSVEDQTIPDRFLDLLEQLDVAESKAKGDQR